MKKRLFIMCMVFAGFATTGVIAQSKTKEKAKTECCTQKADCKKMINAVPKNPHAKIKRTAPNKMIVQQIAQRQNV